MLKEQPVDLLVSSSEPDSEGGGIAITQLSDRGQAALIEQSKGKPPLQLKAAGEGAGSVAIRNSIKRRLVISILLNDFLPAGDRIDAVELKLTVLPSVKSNWQISNWTQASDTRTVIEVGKITGVTATKISATTGLKISEVLPNFTIGGERSRTDTQELQVRDESSFVAGVDLHGTAWLVRRAGYRDDLAHNLSIDVVATSPDIKLKPSAVVSMSALYKETEGRLTPTKPKAVRLKETSVYSPLEGQLEPICGVAKLRYRIRHIDVGNATYPESDDDVEYRNGARETKFLFAPPPYKPTFQIDVNGRALHYQIGPADPNPLRFASLEEVEAFRDWLLEAWVEGGRLANASLGFANRGTNLRALTQADLDDLVVVPSNGEAMRKAAAVAPSDCFPAGPRT